MEEISSLKSQGDASYMDGECEDALFYYSQHIQQNNPHDHEILCKKSKILHSLKQYSKAVDVAAKCIKIKEDYVKGYI